MIFLEDIDPIIQKELTKRMSLVNNPGSDEKNMWENGKTAWIKMTSNAEILSKDGKNYDGGEIAKKWILYGGISTTSGYARRGFDYPAELSTYGDTSIGGGSEGYYKPMPGIIEISVNNKGTLGSLREGNIKFYCGNLQQLEVLEKLYMTPGISVVLEWGWSVDDEPPLQFLTAGSDIFNVDEKTRINKRIDFRKKIRDSNGKYDGMIGIVVDFDWNLAKDGVGFDCSTKIVSSGYILESLSCSSNSLNKRIKLNEHDEETTLVSNFTYKLNELKKILDKEGEVIYGKEKNYATVLKYTFPLVEGETNRTRYYCNIAYLENILINETMLLSTDNKQLVINVNSKNNLCRINKYTRSFNPLICILPGAYTGNYNVSSNFDYNTLTSIRANEPDREFPILSNSSDDVEGKGIISNIYIDLEFIEKCYNSLDNGEGSIADFLNIILKGVNNACGDVFNLILQVNQYSPNIMDIVDVNNLNKNPQPFQFTVNSRNSIIRDLHMSSNIPSSLVTAMFIGANKAKNSIINTNPGHSDSINKFEFNSRDRLHRNIKESAIDHNVVGNEVIFQKSPIANILVNSGTKVNPTLSNEHKDEEDITLEELEQLYAENLLKLFQNINSDDIVKSLQQTYKKLISKRLSTFDEEVDLSLIPLSLSLTIPGISGIIFGNSFIIDYIPERYKNRVIFMITEVNDSVVNNNWETTFNTIMRMKPMK